MSTNEEKLYLLRAYLWEYMLNYSSPSTGGYEELIETIHRVNRWYVKELSSD